jgi:uncharacterized RDD family membrane protein YckC
MKSKFCTQCNTQVMSTLLICPSCGNRSFGDSPTMQPRPAPHSGHGNTPQATSSQQAHTAQTFASTQPPIIPSGLVPAHHGKRFFAYLIDYLIVTVAATIGGALVGLTSLAGTGGTALGGGLLFLAVILLPFIYFTYFHSTEAGATLGKKAMKIKLVSSSGARVSAAMAFVRCLLTLVVPFVGYALVGLSTVSAIASGNEGMIGISAVAIVLGFFIAAFGPYLMIFFNNERQSLFDIMCRTRVVERN